jgi:hypothetical protein
MGGVAVIRSPLIAVVPMGRAFVGSSTSCELSCLLVLSLATIQGFSPGYPVFLPP